MKKDELTVHKELKTFIEEIDHPGKGNSNFRSFSEDITGKINFSSLIKYFTNKEIKFFYWHQPSEGLEFIGADPLFEIKENGKNRFPATQEKYELLKSILVEEKNDNLPQLLGGFKFDNSSVSKLWEDFAGSDWFLPSILFIRNNDSYKAILRFSSTDDSRNIYDKFSEYSLAAKEEIIENKEELTPEISHCNGADAFSLWEEKVNGILNEISSKSLQKVVLSRMMECSIPNERDLYSFTEKLSRRFKFCYIFAFNSGKSVFFGATPEKLLKVTNGKIETDALAGSIRRDKDAIKDYNLAESLLSSKKNLAEQKAVVDFLVSSIEDFTEDISFNKMPVIRKLPNIQHLWSKITGKLKPGYKIFEILKSIHPTPAVCGLPWDAAMEYIRKAENHDRGLFTGTIGWVDTSGNAEFAVGIRSALIKESRLYVFAGCGIVDGSDPETEYSETELKFSPILSLFKNED